MEQQPVAGLLQSYVSAWIFGFDERNPTSSELPAATADFHISRMHESARAFWKSYGAGRNFDRTYAPQFLRKTMGQLGCRMIQTAVEGALKSPTIPANSMRAVQVAFNAMQRPESAARDLLDLP